jgi:hypothetical protein
MRSIDLSHPFRMLSSLTAVPGVFAALQPLAIFFYPFGVVVLNLIPLAVLLLVRFLFAALAIAPLVTARSTD